MLLPDRLAALVWLLASCMQPCTHTTTCTTASLALFFLFYHCFLAQLPEILVTTVSISSRLALKTLRAGSLSIIIHIRLRPSQEPKICKQSSCKRELDFPSHSMRICHSDKSFCLVYWTSHSPQPLASSLISSRQNARRLP